MKPQVEATAVIQKLLKWISRVDAASRASLVRPPFCDEDGGGIFPEGPWWLTDISRRAEEEQKSSVTADVEDGPPSEMEEEGEEPAEVSDEDPLSEAESEPARHTPIPAWHQT